MVRNPVVICKATPSGVFIPCPVCRSGKLMRLYPETAAACVSLYCRKCKRESIIDIRAGDGLDRVTLHRPAQMEPSPRAAAQQVTRMCNGGGGFSNGASKNGQGG